MRAKLLVIMALLMAAYFLAPEAITAPDFHYYSGGYPRLANLYWKTPVTMEEAKELARWDLLVLDMGAQNDSAAAISEIRKLNPGIIILAYVSFTEAPRSNLAVKEPSGQGVWHDFVAGLKPGWFLKTYDGATVSWWADNRSINPCGSSGGQPYRDYAVDFLDNEVMSSGLWDGLLFDTAWQEVAWVDEKIDIDSDRQPDSKDKINSMWLDCHQEFFNSLRQRIGDRIIVANGDGKFDNINGRMLEGFPEIWEGGWTGSMRSYLASATNGSALPRINIINSDTDNTGNNTQYQAVRFTLASALLSDGYYSYDYGPALREQLWTYDEYAKLLGMPVGEAFNIYDKSDREIKDGTWRRDFEGGIAIVNATSTASTVKLEKLYRKIDGQDNPLYNNGNFVSQVTLQPWDGVVLLDPVAATWAQ